MENESITVQKSDGSVKDPLLSCLLALTKYYGRTVSPNTLRANLPLVENRLTPELFVQAAERIQLTARLVKRSLPELTNMVLPVVLLLRDNNACVLLRLYDDGTGEFIFPGKENPQRLSLSDVARNYLGTAIYVNPAYRFEERADEYQIEKPVAWFWDTIWRYRHIYYHIALASLLINCFIIAAPLFVMNVYDRVVPNKALPTLWALTIGILIIFVFDFILRMIRGYLLDVSGKKADVILSSELFKHLMELKIEAKPASAGAFANSFHGFDAVRDFFTSATLTSVIDLPFIFLFILIIAYIGGWLAIIPLLAIPLVIIVSLLLEIPIHKSVEQSFVGAAQKHAILVESINRLDTIKTTLAEGEQQRKWDFYTTLVAGLAMKSRFYSSLAVNFASYVLQMVYVIMIVAGVYAINAKMLTLGGLIACSILGGRTLAPLTQIASLITRYHQAKIGLEALNRIMELPVERQNKKNYLYRPRVEGDVQFNNVGFTYPNQTVPALINLSFKIKANEKVAILGRIGSGKSTILKLIIGLYSPTSGSILIDGVDIHQSDPADIRRNIGFVPQESNLFYGTLRDNICKSAPWASNEELLRAADVTGISHYTNRHPSGFDLRIGENGVGLSSGQQQSVAIARALLPDPPILLFDDATSEIDDTSEKELREKLQPVIKNKTFILVTHKLSMLSLVDRIIILNEGRLVADGKKEEILKMLGQ